MTAVYEYIGPRNAAGQPTRFLSGIPARDIESDAWNKLSDADKARVDASALYHHVGTARKAAPIVEDVVMSHETVRHARSRPADEGETPAEAPAAPIADEPTPEPESV